MMSKLRFTSIFAATVVGLCLGQRSSPGQNQFRLPPPVSQAKGTAPVQNERPLPVLRSASPLPFRNTINGHALVSCAEAVVQSGSPLLSQVEFRCSGGFTHVYDAFFCTADPKRAELRVFDDKGKYIGNALREVIYDERGRGRWLYVQDQIINGRLVPIATGDRTTFATDRQASPQNGLTIDTLGAGKYSLQFVLMGRYLDFRSDSSEEPQLRPRITETQEVCFSNVLEIEIEPRKDPPRDAQTRGDAKVRPGGARIDTSLNDAAQQREPPFVAKLIVDNSTIKTAGQINFTIVLVNKSDASVPFMNPWHSFPVPAETTRLLALDSGGKAIGDLLGFRKVQGGGSLTASTNWITLPPGSIYGFRDRIPASISSLASDLAPGAYRIQMVFLDRFASEHPYSGLPPPELVRGAERSPSYVERLRKWRSEYSGKELFRSNAVEIMVVDE